MTKPLSIVIIGTGNVSTQLAMSFQNSKQAKLVQVFNHKVSKRAKDFSKKFNCDLVTDYNNISTTADIYIIAVKDDTINEVVKNIIPLKLKGLVVHTSGSINITALKAVSKEIGSYYPLQTFYPNAKIDWSTTPLLIESNTKTGLAKLKTLATSISKNVKQVNSVERLRLHLAAVFASNFTNALYVSAFELIEKNLNKKDSNLLLPIMQQSFDKLKTVHPKQAQTGPAMRNDKVVIKKHLDLLKTNKELTSVYKLLTQLIIHQQGNN